MAEATYPGIVVPAIPPRPPTVTLIGSSIRPTDSGNDPASPTFSVGAEQLALLPADARAELQARRGEGWVRGLRYAPENQYAGVVRDRCDFTTIDYAAMPAPLSLAAVAAAGGGTVPAELLEYAVTAFNANGETTRSAIVSITPGAIGTVTLTWHKVNDTAEYRVYRIKGGTKKPVRLAGVVVKPPTGSALETTETLQTVTYVDTGGAAEEAGKEPPSTNTTAGPGSYTNLPEVEYVPVIIIAADQCSSFGFEERDFKGRALRLLDFATPRALEKEFWTGALATAKSYPNNFIMQTGKVTDLTPGSVPSVERGVEMLQAALAESGGGGQGMIHLQVQTTPSGLRVRRVGNLMYDFFDNIVVPGVGYPTTGPGGVAPKAGNAFIAATDVVMTRIEKEGTIFPDSFAEAMDWGQTGRPNTIRFAAQRFAAAYFDGARQFCTEVVLPT